jgi:alkylation response protein AidB-like acyl-CoA dehydrogenase
LIGKTPNKRKLGHVEEHGEPGGELTLSDEQAELGRELRRFFADKSPITEVRRLMVSEPGYDPALWARMAGQLGLQGLAIPEEYGGAGFGLRELVIVAEEMGRVLLCAPYLSGVLAAQALLTAADDLAKAGLLPGIADGTTLATLVTEGVTARHEPVFEAPPGRTGWTLSGAQPYVLDGHLADLLVVAASGSLFAVDGAAPGVARTPLTTLDQTRRLARVEFRDVPARPIGPEGRADLSQALDRAAVVLAAEQLGGAQRVLEMSVEYAKVREQFGRPIGSFQAIKHKCADMFVAVESSRSTVLHAAAVADSAPADLPAAAALARAYCSDAYFQAAGENIQIHGGIGFTWEHDAHLFFKRAKSAQTLLASPAECRARLAVALELVEEPVDDLAVR